MARFGDFRRRLNAIEMVIANSSEHHNWLMSQLEKCMARSREEINEDKSEKRAENDREIQKLRDRINEKLAKIAGECEPRSG